MNNNSTQLLVGILYKMHSIKRFALSIEYYILYTHESENIITFYQNIVSWLFQFRPNRQ